MESLLAEPWVESLAELPTQSLGDSRIPRYQRRTRPREAGDRAARPSTVTLRGKGCCGSADLKEFDGTLLQGIYSSSSSTLSTTCTITVKLRKLSLSAVSFSVCQ